MNEAIDIARPAHGQLPAHLNPVANFVTPTANGGLKAIMAEVSEKYGVSISDIQSASHKHLHVIPRHEFFWRAREVLKPDGKPRYSFPKIGRFVGGRDHTTALNGRTRHEERREVWRVVLAELGWINP